MSIFLSLSVRFSPETIYFVPVLISFILNEYSLYNFILYNGTWCTYASLQLHILCISSGRGVT